MGKANRATRKELEEIVGGLIQEVQYLRQIIPAVNNLAFYIENYIKYKGDTIEYTNYFNKECEKVQKVETSKPEEKMKSDKKNRYNKVTTPPL